MTVSGRASYVRQHECHTSTTPAVLLLIGGIGSGRRYTMDQSQLPDLR